jgi:hypothetical protein
MTVNMAKTAAATVASDVTGKIPPDADELGVVCLMDMRRTTEIMKAYPVLPPRQNSCMKKTILAKPLKVQFERCFLWKMKLGLSNLLVNILRRQLSLSKIKTTIVMSRV